MTRMTLLTTATVVGLHSTAFAGSSNSYAMPQAQQETSITTFTAAAPPVMETYIAPAPIVTQTVTEPVKDGYYDDARYGGNAEFGYEQSHACGGVLDGEKCLVILSNHMRRVRLERPAGTILVGNPLIADVTVLGNDTLFVSARTIGSTNIIVLDKQGNEIVTFEAFVREPRTKMVILRNAGVAESYQCAPYCERALTQSDSVTPNGILAGIISTDLGLDSQAIGLQSGANPNTDPNAYGATQQQQQNTTLPGSGASAGGAAAAGANNGALASSVGNLAAQTGPAMSLLQSLTGLAGPATGGVAAPTAAAPSVRTDAPPLPN